MEMHDAPPSKRIKLDAGFASHILSESGTYSESGSEAYSSSAKLQSTSSKSVVLDQAYSKTIALDHVKVPELCYPASQFDGWEPPCAVLPEEEALGTILVMLPTDSLTSN
jgi:hypothetical protein